MHSVDDSYVFHLHINITDLSLKRPHWSLETAKGYLQEPEGKHAQNLHQAGLT